MKPSGSTSRRDKELKDFNMNFGNSEDKFLDLDNGCENHIVIIRKFDINRISMISLRTRFRIIFISQKTGHVIKQIFQNANSVEDIAGYFNYDLQTVSSDQLLDHMIVYPQIVDKSTHISGLKTDHLYIKNALLEEFHTKAIVQNIYFSDYDYNAARIIFRKN